MMRSACRRKTTLHPLSNTRLVEFVEPRRESEATASSISLVPISAARSRNHAGAVAGRDRRQMLSSITGLKATRRRLARTHLTFSHRRFARAICNRRNPQHVAHSVSA